MSIWSILLIGIGLSMDAFAVSVTNGIVTRGLNWKITLRIALSFGIFQALMPIIGYFAGIYFSGIIESFSGSVSYTHLDVYKRQLARLIASHRRYRRNVSLTQGARHIDKMRFNHPCETPHL